MEILASSVRKPVPNPSMGTTVYEGKRKKKLLERIWEKKEFGKGQEGI